MEQSKFKYTSDFVEYLEQVELQRDTFKRAYLLEKDKNEQLTKERDQLRVALEIVTNELESWKATEEDPESIRAIQISKQAIRDSKGLSLAEHDTQVIRDFCNFALKKYRYDLSGFADEFNQLRQIAQESFNDSE